MEGDAPEPRFRMAEWAQAANMPPAPVSVLSPRIVEALAPFHQSIRAAMEDTTRPLNLQMQEIVREMNPMLSAREQAAAAYVLKLMAIAGAFSVAPQQSAAQAVADVMTSPVRMAVIRHAADVLKRPDLAGLAPVAVLVSFAAVLLFTFGNDVPVDERPIYVLAVLTLIATMADRIR